MYRLTQQPSARKVTPRECEEFLAINNFPGQRQINPVKARRYGELLMAGRLRPVDIAIATLPDGTKVLVNGQHVCTGCVQTGLPMNAVLSYYKCEELRDAWELFASFDVHASRTQSQIFKAARGLFSNEELREVPLRVLQTAGSALAALLTPVPNFLPSVEKSAKVALTEDHADEVLWLASFDTEADHMIRVGCYAAMVATRRRDAADAEKFWRKVQSGVGFKSLTDPERKVNHFLQKNSKWTAPNSRTMHFAVYVTCIAWWNTWRRGESRTSVKIKSMKVMPEIV
jgi:hypothetical protein